MKIEKADGNEYVLTWKGFKIRVTRLDLILLRNFINTQVNDLEN